MIEIFHLITILHIAWPKWIESILYRCVGISVINVFCFGLNFVMSVVFLSFLKSIIRYGFFFSWETNIYFCIHFCIHNVRFFFLKESVQILIRLMLHKTWLNPRSVNYIISYHIISYHSSFCITEILMKNIPQVTTSRRHRLLKGSFSFNTANSIIRVFNKQ